MLDNKDKIGAFLILAFALFYLVHALNLSISSMDEEGGFTSRTLPIGLAGFAILFALIQLFLPVADSEAVSIRKAIQGFRWRPVILLIVLMFVYSLSFSFLGFVIATVLFLSTGFIILGERRPMPIIAISAGLGLFMWGLLTQIFGLYLDPGDVYRWLFGNAL